MIERKARRRSLLLVAGLAIGVLLGPALTGCGADDVSMAKLIEAMRSPDKTLSADARRELARFDTVYRAYVTDATDTHQLKHFRDAFARLRVDYLVEIPDSELIDAAVDGVRGLNAEPHSVASRELVEVALDSMVASLDPHSSYLNSEELREALVSTRGQFGGLGIEVTMENGLVKVVSPIEDTPAYRAGLQSGDLITHIDGDVIEGTTIMEAVRRMRGRPGTDIRLGVRRQGVPPFEVTITRAIITVRAVRWRIEGDFGYLRVASFNEQLEDNIEDAVDAIRRELGPRLRGIVLDLRNNPGGLLDESLMLADSFMDRGLIVSVRGRRPDSEQVYEASKGDLMTGLPMVILINGGSASASEIVAAALQEDGRATVMGARSFGKGSVQTITPLPVEGALKLTTALYYTPSGRTIQGTGVVPDIEITSETVAQRQRESDLPGALSSRSTDAGRSLISMPDAECPKWGDAEEPDRVLGCALAFLDAGSAARFLAAFPGRKPL